MSPPPKDPVTINRDLVGTSVEFEQVFHESIRSGKSTLSRPVDVKSVFGSNLPESDTPQSMFLEPVMSGFGGENPRVVGSIVAVIPWDSYLSNVSNLGCAESQRK